jgi:peptidoglycan/LPS O-acetylase OafA/YrhL
LHLGYLIPWFKGYHWLNQVYWTLAVEFQYYLFIALLFGILIKTKFEVRIIIYISFLGGSYLGNAKFLPYWLPVFLLGILLFLFSSGVIFKKEFYICAFGVICFCFYRYPIASVFYSVIPLVFILYWKDLKIYGLHFLGKFSYSIYLIHPLLGASLINILSHHFTGPLQKIGVILAGITVTILGSWVVYIYVEKPSKRLADSIRYNNAEKN